MAGKMPGDIGGPGRDRTDDLFHAMEARSQLRHRPTVSGDNTSCPLRTALSILAYPHAIVNAVPGKRVGLRRDLSTV
jgi:hypothetical protein